MMRWAAQLSCLLLSVAGLNASGLEFRVELLSGSVVRQASIEAGASDVRLCRASAKNSCRTIPPKGSAVCVVANAGIQCETSRKGDAADRPFLSGAFEISSGSEFRLQAKSLRNGKTSEDRWFSLRQVRLSSSEHGLRIVATLDLETYVAAVLAGEAGTMHSPAALEAMAVVARTWALGARGRHGREGFDFCSLTHCQVLRLHSAPSQDPTDAWSAAAKATEGETLHYHGRLAEAYFSADCGGRTEAAADLWPDRAAPYLPSLPDPYCGSSVHSSWERRLTLLRAAQILEEDMGVHLEGHLSDLRVESRDASGRARMLVALGRAPHLVNANDFRFAINRKLGWDTLLSNLYTIETANGVLLFRGRGLGHGVGLCQAGAEQMARLGADYRKLLSQYFPGTDARRVSSDPILSSEHFELAFPTGQQIWAGETLSALERERAWLGRAGLELPAKIRVETWATTEEFIHATGEPGWMAATTDGRAIALQPLKNLHDRGILASTLRHELAHLGVHRRRAASVPQWFEEGLVIFLTGEHPPVSPATVKGRNLEQRIERPHSEAEMKQAYAEALERVQRLAKAKGREGLWQMLEHPTAQDLAWFKDQE